MNQTPADEPARPARAPYRAPELTVHGTVAEMTQRNFFGPGRQDGPYWWRRTG